MRRVISNRRMIDFTLLKCDVGTKCVFGMVKSKRGPLPGGVGVLNASSKVTRLVVLSFHHHEMIHLHFIFSPAACACAVE